MKWEDSLLDRGSRVIAGHASSVRHRTPAFARRQTKIRRREVCGDKPAAALVYGGSVKMANRLSLSGTFPLHS
jgi:hypothetical protein